MTAAGVNGMCGPRDEVAEEPGGERLTVPSPHQGDHSGLGEASGTSVLPRGPLDSAGV